MTGAQADSFNAVFGIQTDFAAITPLDNQGNPVRNTGSTSGPPYFGKCSTPEIKFAPGLDGKKETAFAPVDEGPFLTRPRPRAPM